MARKTANRLVFLPALAIDIAIRYRYRSCPAFSIASSDIDSGPERTTAPAAVLRAMGNVSYNDTKMTRSKDDSSNQDSIIQCQITSASITPGMA